MADMYESILMYADIDESPEVGHVRHNARQLHSYFQVIDRINALLKAKGFKRFAWIASGFLQFGENVIKCWQSDLFRDVLIQVKLLTQFGAAHQVFHRAAQVVG